MADQNPNYITPEEADLKTCPFITLQTAYILCHGPACMAWRWHPVISKAIFYQPHPAKPVPDPNWILEEQISETVGLYKEGPTHGYCGMVRS